MDDVLHAASLTGKLPFMIDKAAKLGPETPISETSVILPVGGGTTTADLQLHMTRIPSGRWKVDRVTWKGSSTEMQPWGIDEAVPRGPS